MLTRVHPWLILLAATAPALGAQLSLPTATIASGSSLSLPLEFASESKSVSSVQFDLQFASPILSLNATPGAIARSSGKSLYVWQLYPGLWRFVIVGLNQTPLTDGTLVNLFVNISPAAFPDSYPLQILNIVAGDPSGQPVAIAETDGSITVNGDASTAIPLQASGVLNAASQLSGGVSPGEILTLFGAAIGPASVQFDGIPAPILYAGAGQINLIAPYAIQGKSSTQIQVIQGSQVIAKLQLPVLDASPAIFTLDSSGVGQGAILNQDYSLNTPSTPAAKGSVVMIFATGAGQMNPPGVDGQITGETLAKPLLPVSVKIGSAEALVLYAGAAPGLVSGMLQVNCAIPLNSPSGWTVPIVLTVGTAQSKSGVTLAIQ